MTNLDSISSDPVTMPETWIVEPIAMPSILVAEITPPDLTNPLTSTMSPAVNEDGLDRPNDVSGVMLMDWPSTVSRSFSISIESTGPMTRGSYAMRFATPLPVASSTFPSTVTTWPDWSCSWLPGAPSIHTAAADVSNQVPPTFTPPASTPPKPATVPVSRL